MLKGVRQAVCLRFSINEMTLEAMRVRAAAIVRVAPERVTYELSLLFSCGAFRRAVTLLHDCGLDVPLFGRALDSSQWHADDVPLAAAMALVVGDPRAYSERWRWSESLRRDVASLQRIESTDRLAMFNAGESAARQYPALLRALGRNKDAALAEDAMSDALFEMRALLTGEEIAEITGIEPGRALGAIKRELLEAQVRGDVTTREQALAFVSSSDGRATRRP
jgi:tRNA nucleotidyltransferase/poly(A) polymerase